MDRSGGWGRARKLLSWAEDDADSFDPLTWAGPDSSLSDRNPLWANYAILVDLYKHYLDVAWKASVWYYAVTGAILTYYLGHDSDQLPGPLPLLLLFLALVSLGLALLNIKAAGNFMSTRDLLERIACKLNLPGRPHVEFAVDFVIFNALLMVIICCAAMGLFVADLDELAWS